MALIKIVMAIDAQRIYETKTGKNIIEMHPIPVVKMFLWKRGVSVIL